MKKYTILIFIACVFFMVSCKEETKTLNFEINERSLALPIDYKPGFVFGNGFLDEGDGLYYEYSRTGIVFFQIEEDSLVIDESRTFPEEFQSNPEGKFKGVHDLLPLTLNEIIVVQKSSEGDFLFSHWDIAKGEIREVYETDFGDGVVFHNGIQGTLSMAYNEKHKKLFIHTIDWNFDEYGLSKINQKYLGEIDIESGEFRMLNLRYPIYYANSYLSSIYSTTCIDTYGDELLVSLAKQDKIYRYNVETGDYVGVCPTGGKHKPFCVAVYDVEHNNEKLRETLFKNFEFSRVLRDNENGYTYRFYVDALEMDQLVESDELKKEFGFMLFDDDENCIANEKIGTLRPGLDMLRTATLINDKIYMCGEIGNVAEFRNISVIELEKGL